MKGTKNGENRERDCPLFIKMNECEVIVRGHMINVSKYNLPNKQNNCVVRK